MSEWNIGQLSDIAEITMGQSPKGDSVNEVGDGLPLLNGPTEFGSNHPIPKQYTTSPIRLAQADDLLFCVRGSTTGRMNWADQEYVIGRGLASIRHKENLQAYLRGVIEYKLPELLTVATGSTFPNVSKSQLHELEIPIPPLDEQKRIAHILGSLDDKIEANRRMNETLEATARAIFKSWFVDFDPVYAKAEGRDPVGMDAHTADLFPDSFEDSELGLIPSGWRVVSIGEHVKASKGLSYKGKHLEESIEDGLPMHNLNSIYEGGTYKYDGIKFYSGDYKPRHEVKQLDLIVANTEQGHNLLLIASPALIPKTFGEKGIISHHIFKVEVKKKSPLTKLFLYYLIMMRPFRDVLQGYTNGTTVNMLPADAFEKPTFVLPSAEIMQKFDALIMPMLGQIEHNVEESRTLAETRDALLPKLVSGALRVGEVG